MTDDPTTGSAKPEADADLSDQELEAQAGGAEMPTVAPNTYGPGCIVTTQPPR